MPRILIVEDDPVAAQMMQDLLSIDYEADTVEDGTDALELLLINDFDLVVLDWDIPGVPGPAICTNIRAASKQMPILMMTGKTNLDDKEFAFEAGVDDYMVKPYEPKELLARVKALLRRSARQANAQEAQAPAILPRIDELIGKIISDKYKIESIIGQGFMGVVYKGKHQLLDRDVAVKMLLPNLVSNPLSKGRFEREAHASSLLDHPNIVTLYDYGITKEGLPYLVSEYLEGRSIEKIISEERYLSAGRAVAIFVQACDALAHAHEKGLVHRDIKPSNFILLKSGKGERLKLIDFGIVKLLDSQNKESQVLTQSGEMFGTPYYMSPEQCMGKEADERSDIFSFSCVMYHVLTGQIAFAGENPLESMYLRMQEKAQAFKEANPRHDIPPELEAIVMKGLSRNPQDRYQSMAELQTELLRL